MSCRRCQSVVCEAEQDDRAYSLQGLPTLPTPPTPIPSPAAFGNDVVYYESDCSDGETLTYNGTLPGWITIDTDNNRLAGAAATFRADVKSDATSYAQSRLDDFADGAIGDGDLTCEP